MGIASQVSLLVVVVLGIMSSPIFNRRGHFLLRRFGGWVIGIPALIMTGVALYLTHAQFSVWQNDPISKYLLPPYHSISYFIVYAGAHFWITYFISFVIAFVVYVIAAYMNARRGGIFFEKEELYFLPLGIFLTGHPGWILYMVITLFLYCALCVVRFAVRKEMPRTSFYYFWLPCAAATIAANGYMTQFSWYSSLLL